MTLASYAPFESAFHTSSDWLNELRDELGWQDPHQALKALRVVLHALRDRLTVAEAADLSAQLPLLIRGVYFEGWNPSKVPNKERRRDEFLAHVAANFADEQIFPEAVVWAVLKVLDAHVSGGEIKDVKQMLPADIRALWPHTGRHPVS